MKSRLLIIIVFGILPSILNSQDSSPYKYIDSLAYFRYYENGIYDSAEFYFHETIKQKEAIHGRYSLEAANTYLNLGVVYRKLYHLQKALEYFNIAEDIYKSKDSTSILLGYVYNNKGNIYYNYSDFGECERYYKHCIDLLSSNIDQDFYLYFTASLNLFNIYILQNKLTEARTLLNEISHVPLNSLDNQSTINKYKFLAQAYDRLGETGNALEALSIARMYLTKDLSFNPHILIELNFREASIYVQRLEFNKAHDLLLQNLSEFSKLRTIDYEKIANTYRLIGQIHYIKGDYKNCYSWLTVAKKELEEKLSVFSTKDVDINARIYSSFFIDINHLLAQAGEQLYRETNKIEYLFEALDLYTEIIEVQKVFKIHMRNESSIFQNNEYRIFLIHEAIDLALYLYKYTNNREYFDLAYNYTESTKSFVLYKNINEIEAIRFADIPENVKRREASLSSEISAYESMIIEEEISGFKDSVKVETFNRKLFDLKDDYNTLLDSIEKFYPNYFDLKYNPYFISPKEVQSKLNRNEALVEYVLADTVLSILIIDKERIEVIRQGIDTDFSGNCQEYFNLLQSQDFSKDVHHTYERYVTLGKSFYDILVKPVIEVTDSRDITFIPDGEIMYLPFESFITEEVDKQYINYHDLPYLIYDLSIGYSYSSTLLFSDRIKTRSPRHKVLAFAPDYENLHDPIDPLQWKREANPDFLLPLQGAREEVEYISKRVPSVAFMDTAASEANFKKYASDYYVLHLAMHTIMDDEEPMHSKLAFTRNFSDTTQDHDLFTYEIYNMKLNAEMIVLSSCSSGYGKMQKGEGMMSMSRGFMYAGCPSIIMTLWQISDRSSSELMSNFYKHLKHGKSKKKALRQAKIDYIKSSDRLKSNPYFWSAFMVVGDSSPLYGRNAGFYLAVLLSGFLLVVGYSYRNQLLRRRRK